MGACEVQPLMTRRVVMPNRVLVVVLPEGEAPAERPTRTLEAPPVARERGMTEAGAT